MPLPFPAVLCSCLTLWVITRQKYPDRQSQAKVAAKKTHKKAGGLACEGAGRSCMDGASRGLAFGWKLAQNQASHWASSPHASWPGVARPRETLPWHLALLARVGRTQFSLTPFWRLSFRGCHPTASGRRVRFWLATIYECGGLGAALTAGSSTMRPCQGEVRWPAFAAVSIFLVSFLIF